MPKHLRHGSYRIKVVDRIIISESFGSWNDITIKHFVAEYKQKAAPLLDAPWAGLVDVSQWQLATQDAEVFAKEFEQWCKTNNRTHIAIVGSNAMVDFQLNRSGLKALPDQITVNHFNNQAQALDWLADSGFLLEDTHSTI
ncbi:MAG: hypothetical protein ACPGR2_16510 [Psychrobium sp.]